MIRNLLHSARILADACGTFREFCVEGLQPNRARIDELVRRLADARDRAQPEHRLRQRGGDREEGPPRGTTLKEAALALGLLTEQEYDEAVRPEDMV